jgi:hypothetical protein
LRHEFLLTDNFDPPAAATQLGWHPELPRRIEMDTNEKINLWLKMGETIGVPQNQIQIVRGARKGLSDGVYRVTWAGTVDGESPESAAQMALVRLYADVKMRPDLFILSVQDKDNLVTQIDLSGPKFLAALQAGLKCSYADDANSDEQVLVGSEQHLGVQS